MLGRLERTPARTKSCSKFGRTAKTTTRGNLELDTGLCERDVTVPVGTAKERAVLSASLRKPAAATHWSTRRLAKEVGLSRATVHRIWRKYGLQPHWVETFKFSADPDFDRKLADVVGLYLDPSERALVLCVDEKSQIQALERTQPAQPRSKSRPDKIEPDRPFLSTWANCARHSGRPDRRHAARPLR
jgi:transcriptional regulator with XRE-family HTH domain